MDNNIELLDGIDLYLSGKRPGTVKAYGSFLKNFFSLLLTEYGWVMPSDLSVPECAERFETYCRENNYKESTARSFRYALRSYLSFLHIELEPYDLSSKPWEERMCSV